MYSSDLYFQYLMSELKVSFKFHMLFKGVQFVMNSIPFLYLQRRDVTSGNVSIQRFNPGGYL